MKAEEARQILGLDADCTLEDVHAAYRTRARETHPDAGGTAEEFSTVKHARDLLVVLLTVPKPTAGPCAKCGGTGRVRSPSRRLGSLGLWRRCTACEGLR